MKSPAFQFYPDDFLGSGKVGTMTTEEVGAYTLLLCLDWSETGFVYDEEELSRWCRLSRAKFRRAWIRVSRCFVEREGRLFNPRLEVERTKQAEWREKSAKGGRASGEARAKGGGKGGSTTVQRVVQPLTQPNGNTPPPTPVSTRATTSPPRAAAKVARSTWMTPYCAAWSAQYDGDLPVEPSVKPLGKLRTQHGDDEVLRRWAIYLAATPGQYASAVKFAATWGQWSGQPVANESPRQLRATEQLV